MVPKSIYSGHHVVRKRRLRRDVECLPGDFLYLLFKPCPQLLLVGFVEHVWPGLANARPRDEVRAVEVFGLW